MSTARLAEQVRGPTARAIIEALTPWIKPRRMDRMKRVLCQRTAHVRLVLENLSDPHNTAACLRTADAFGVHHIDVIDRYAPFRVNQAVSSGAHKWLSVQHHRSTLDCIRALMEARCTIIASHVHESAQPLQALAAELRSPSAPPQNDEDGHGGSVADVDGDGAEPPPSPLAIVFGNETRGVSQTVLRSADSAFYIPMAGMTESFNVSVACAVTLAQLQLALPQHMGTPFTEAQQEAWLAQWLVCNVTSSKAVLLQAGIEVDDL